MDSSPQAKPRLRFLLTFAAHLAVWCGVSALLFGGGFHSARVALLAVLYTPIEPIRLGVHFVAAGDADVAAASILVTVGVVVFAIGAMLEPERRLMRRLSHVALGAYGFWSLCLLGSGV
jgi:hypothetical protein